MWFLYQTLPGRLLLALPPTWWVLGWQHRRLAAYANSPRSKKSIPGLIKVWAGVGRQGDSGGGGGGPRCV